MTIFNTVNSNGVVQPGDTIVARMQNRRGYKKDLPQPLFPGELGWCIDTKELFIGLDDSTSSSVLALTSGSTAQSFLDTNIIQFSSKWVNLNVTGNLDAGTTISNQSEKTHVQTIMRASGADFMNKVPAGNTIKWAIRNVRLLRHFETAIGLTTLNNVVEHKVISVEKKESNNAIFSISTSVGGVVTSATVVDGGLGYLKGSNVTISSPGGGITTAASFNVTASTLEPTTDSATNTGEGVITAITLVSGGSTFPASIVNVPYSVNLPVYTPYTAIVPVLTTGPTAPVNITSTTVIPLVTQGKFYKTNPSVVVSGGTFSTTLKTPVTVTAVNRNPVYPYNILSITIQGHTGVTYTAPPTITIAPPLTQEFYKFTYQIGIPGYTSGQSDIVCSVLNAFDDPDYGSTSIINLISPTETAKRLGTGGYNYLYTTNSNNEDSIQFSSANEASSAATILNQLAPRTPLLATTSQNIEVLTRFSTLPPESADAVYEDGMLYSGVLNIRVATTTPYTTVMVSPPGGGPAVPVTVSANGINVRHLQYSIAGTSFIQAGTISMAINNAAKILQAETHTGTLNVVFSIEELTPGVGTLRYKQDIATNLVFKFISTSWNA